MNVNVNVNFKKVGLYFGHCTKMDRGGRRAELRCAALP